MKFILALIITIMAALLFIAIGNLYYLKSQLEMLNLKSDTLLRMTPVIDCSGWEEMDEE